MNLWDETICQMSGSQYSWSDDYWDPPRWPLPSSCTSCFPFQIPVEHPSLRQRIVLWFRTRGLALWTHFLTVFLSLLLPLWRLGISGIPARLYLVQTIGSLIYGFLGQITHNPRVVRIWTAKLQQQQQKRVLSMFGQLCFVSVCFLCFSLIEWMKSISLKYN